MSKLVNVGFYNFVAITSIIAVIDYRLVAARRIVKSVREERPRNIMDLTKSKGIRSLVVLTGDRYVLSNVYPRKLVGRIQTIFDEDDSDT
jgi:regulator of extracellular matrix RemA (YlzA/DUF370 family)